MNPSQMLKVAHFVVQQQDVLEKRALIEKVGPWGSKMWGAARGWFGRGAAAAEGAAGTAGRAAGAAEGAAGRAVSSAGTVDGRIADLMNRTGGSSGAASMAPPPIAARPGYAIRPAQEMRVGSGKRLWGAPSAEQIARGNRGTLMNPRNWRGFWQPRQYANDRSFARMVFDPKNALYAGAFLGADNLINTPDRLYAATRTGAAHAIHQMRQGTTWDRLRNSLGITFGSPETIRDVLRSKGGKDNVSIANRFYELEQNDTPAMKGNPMQWKDYFNYVIANESL